MSSVTPEGVGSNNGAIWFGISSRLSSIVSLQTCSAPAVADRSRVRPAPPPFFDGAAWLAPDRRPVARLIGSGQNLNQQSRPSNVASLRNRSHVASQARAKQVRGSSSLVRRTATIQWPIAEVKETTRRQELAPALEFLHFFNRHCWPWRLCRSALRKGSCKPRHWRRVPERRSKRQEGRKKEENTSMETPLRIDSS